MDLQTLLEWDKAGPVAILMFICVSLVLFSRWVLSKLLETKDRQITRLEAMNDRLTFETAATLKKILDAVRASAEKGADR